MLNVIVYIKKNPLEYTVSGSSDICLWLSCTAHLEHNGTWTVFSNDIYIYRWMICALKGWFLHFSTGIFVFFVGMERLLTFLMFKSALFTHWFMTRIAVKLQFFLQSSLPHIKKCWAMTGTSWIVYVFNGLENAI